MIENTGSLLSLPSSCDTYGGIRAKAVLKYTVIFSQRTFVPRALCSSLQYNQIVQVASQGYVCSLNCYMTAVSCKALRSN